MTLKLRPMLVATALVFTTGGVGAGVVAANAAQAPRGAAGTTATFTKSSDWGTGLVGEYVVRSGGAGLDKWEMTFELPAGSTVGSFWNATLTQKGTRVVAVNREYNGKVAKDASTSFGFVVNGPGSPAKCTLNGASCGGGDRPEPPKPTLTQPNKPTPTAPPTTPRPTQPQPSNGNTVFAPYIHMSVNGRPSLAQIAKDSGAKGLSLAFVINSGSGCDLKWDGNTELGAYQAEINALKAAGAQPIVSTGGAMGSEVAVGCRTASATAAQLEKVLALGVRYLDFDVEGASVGDATANTARGEAIKHLQGKYADLKVSFTLASLPPDKHGAPGGVMEKDQAPWKAAVAAGARIDRVNIMTMNFGSYYDEGKGSTIMGQKSIAAAKDLQKQIKAIHRVGDVEAWRMVGITPMIGVNDTTTEIFQLTNANEIAQFAKANGVGLVSFWSISRDTGCGAGTAQPSPVCSGVGQGRYDFSKRFAAAQ